MNTIFYIVFIACYATLVAMLIRSNRQCKETMLHFEEAVSMNVQLTADYMDLKRKYEELESSVQTKGL